VLTVAVLGLVEVRKDDERLSVPAGKTTEVLIRLALDAGTQVRSERLIEDLWSEQAPGVARNTLQSKVSQLRRVLGDPGLVRGAAGGYTLLVDPGRVDALAVLRQAESVAALRATGNVLAAQAESAIALAKFRGELLPDAGDGEWLAPHRARLEEVRLRLTEDNLAARLELGAAGELVGELEALVHEHPVREGLWMLLITALYRAGRQADALGAYRRVRHQFAENLGLDLGPQLRELEERVLAHDVELVERGRPAAAAAGNLPPLSASLVGRSADLSAITRLVREERLVTMVGPAGVGKTRLAVEVARRAGLAGGAWLARLETAHRPASLWQSIGDAFGLTEATDAVVLDRLHGGEFLLVVDNCEHLIDLLHDPVDRILRASPRLRVLATSQVPLGTDGEAVRLVEPLTLADSVALFTQRASQQRSSFADHVAGRGQRATVEAVCRSLDGLPLAIELAAARTKVLTVQEIARRLDDRFTLLTDPMTSREPRRRTLRAAIAWSYDLLFPDDQRGLWALSCFSGGASLSAVETVLGALGVPPAVAVDVLDRLVDRSLATVDDDMRFHLLDSVRAFSVDRLLASGQTDVARRSHATWFAAAGADVERGIRGPRQPEQLAFVRKERANLDAALEWATTHDPVTALRLAVGFGWAWALLGAGPDAAQRIRDAVNAADADADAPDLSTGLLLAGWLEASGGDLDLATADLHRAAQLGDRQHHLVSQLYLGFVRSQQGRADDALELLTGCIAGFRELGLQWDEGAGWLLSAWAEIALGRLGAAKAACDRALHLLRPLGDQWAHSHAPS
jgi:predicted ATPase/DNA-binding SARP family transcriptional activator